MDLGLENKVALITGGSGGIGGPIARRFGAERARVALTYHRNETAAKTVAQEIEDAGGTAIAVAMDLAEPESVQAAVAQVTKHWGPIEVLVVNASPAAGPEPVHTRFEDVADEVWRSQIRTEVEGAFELTRAVVPAMRTNQWGRIVFVSASVVGRGFPGEEAYIASKAALHGLSRTLACEFYQAGVLSNVVAPGPTVTPNLLRKVADRLDPADGNDPERVRRSLERAMPHLRFSTPDHVATAVAYLASAANGNISGSVVDVAGGM
ncbi:MAG TPA: SDR family NAD(P)-dependent oxidoreductase [Micromonosporaceae bacterium]